MTDLLSGLAGVQSLILALPLLVRPAWRTCANRRLAAALVALAVDLVGDAIPGAAALGYLAFVFLGPLIFLHTDAVVAARRDIAPAAARPHLLGAIAMLVLLTPYLGSPLPERLAIDAGRIFAGQSRAAEWSVLVFSLAVAGQQLVYLVLAMRRLAMLDRDAGGTLGWLQFLIGVTASLWLVYVGSGLVPGFTIAEPILQIAVAVAIQGLAAVAILRPESFAPLTVASAYPPVIVGRSLDKMPANYKRSRLSDAVLEDLLGRVSAAMSNTHVYRDPNLDLGRLARIVGARPDDLSQAFSLRGGRNFYDVIAEWRVRGACILLADPTQADRTVLDIAHEVGFNTKSVFHEAFRRHCGTTPAVWRRRSIAERDGPTLVSPATKS